jgi:O-acetyl-ADP-ribose deacetylase (regulator of RNase III)
LSFHVTAGNIFACHANVLVCPTNVKGALGAGLAKQFKARFPGLEAHYMAACRAKAHTPREPIVWDGGVNGTVVCLATKLDWRDPSELSYVEDSAKALADWLRSQPAGLKVAVPALGCGLGGLSFNDVLPILEMHLRPVSEVHDVLVLLP